MDIDTEPAAQAVEALIADYGRLVFHVIYGLTADWQESQDLAQDTFVQALRAIDAARQASGAHFHAKAWLLQIAVNTVRMHRRRRSIIRVVPFSSLRVEEQGETEIEHIGERVAPVQPVGYGMRAAQDPADIIAEQDAVQRIMYNQKSTPTKPHTIYHISMFDSKVALQLLERLLFVFQCIVSVHEISRQRSARSDN